MPNHFHILAYLKNDFKRANFSKGLAICLRSYTRAMNKRYNRTGSLFQQHTKIKNISVSADPDYYNFICFNYIHQNPLKAGLVQELADWPYSSYREYSASLADSFSSCSIGRNLLDLPFDTSAFIKLTNQVIDTDYLPLKTD
ncbi:MAG: hypothetical protein R3321_08485 [Nitrososphaeraceae archaeon]|nr:hypothetical protein [Nitrososphaeraceae archaeon]